jgi:hypothetical protein
MEYKFIFIPIICYTICYKWINGFNNKYKNTLFIIL